MTEYQKTQGKSSDVISEPSERVIRAILISDTTRESSGFDLNEMLRFAIAHMRIITICGLLGGMVAFAASYLIPKTYRAEVLLAPSEGSSSGSGLDGVVGRYSSIASLVGIGLPGADSFVPAAIARLQSRGFIEDFIVEQKVMSSLYPDEHRTPDGVANGSATAAHTLQDAYRYFVRSIMLVKHDESSNLVTIRIDWRDRQLASEWANALVLRLNAAMRTTAIEETDRSLEYLRAELAKADYVSLKDSIASLIESQINKRMLAVTQPDYAFRVIDSAKPSDENKKVGPKRSIFALLGGFFGAGCGLIMPILRKRKSQPRQSNV